MKTLLKLEDAVFFVLALVTFAQLDYAWWVYLALFLLPDISMIGYAAGPAVGAATYNVAHHQGVAVAVCLLGAWMASSPVLLVGAVLLGHSAFDRVLGYGLKYPDAFKHTHFDELSPGSEA